jgi:hypothetical protein
MTTMNDMSSRTTIVVGASRGLGRGIATAFADAGATVITVSRTAVDFPDSESGAGTIQPEVADASDATVPARLIDGYDPHAIILVAGATPHMRPLRHQTWETFSVNWHTDVRITFHWLREALLTPLRPGSRVVVVSSGAALNPNGSPLSGGYAGAKATASSPATPKTKRSAPAWTSLSPPCCPSSRRRPVSASRPSARTQPKPASPCRTSSSSSRFRCSPQTSPAQPQSHWCKPTRLPSPPPTCSTAPDCRSYRDPAQGHAPNTKQNRPAMKALLNTPDGRPVGAESLRHSDMLDLLGYTTGTHHVRNTPRTINSLQRTKPSKCGASIDFRQLPTTPDTDS